jgi:general secretion pathway protein A
MYTEYFGFREKPFSITPDPRFFYANPVYQEAYANLLYGIRERKGFLVLTGEVGTGKTTILRRLMDNLDGALRFVFFYNTTLSFDELLTFICDELGLRIDEDSRLRKIQALNKFLLEQLRKGSTGALFVDEAQNFSDDVFENFRMLSNLETAREKLLQIVLVGQPELETKLDRPELRQLKQRIHSHFHLGCLREQEVGSFVNHRLSVAGYRRSDLFSQEAVRQIAFHSKGVLRLINIICDNALLIAYAASQKKVSADIIREVARDLRLEPPPSVAKKAVVQEQATLRPPKVEAASPKVITSRHEAFRILKGTHGAVCRWNRRGMSLAWRSGLCCAPK